MKLLPIVLSALLLGGCATMQPQAPKKAPIVKAAPKVQPAPMPAPAPVVIPAPAAPPAVEATPNEVVKKRWYDKFKKHPHFFH